VPVLVRDDGSIADKALVGATETLIAGAHDDLLVILETTVPIGTTRELVAKVAKESGAKVFGCFSPERVLTGQTFRNLAAYPKLVGGTDAPSLARATAFYESVLDAPIAQMQTLEAAEMAKLAETTYRDVNIALANEFARVADRHGIDLSEVIRAANSQPYSHIHEPGIGVGGHCIPVYPRMILSTDGDLEVIKTARAVNDGQVERAADAIAATAGNLSGATVAVLGLTYREGVRELAHARGPLMADVLRARGATVLGADPLLSADDVAALKMTPWDGATNAQVTAVVVATADAEYRTMDFARLFPGLKVLIDGRNACAGATLPAGAKRIGFGRPDGVAAQ
jgi:nucleotide sugar dehydrogenase